MSRTPGCSRLQDPSALLLATMLLLGGCGPDSSEDKAAAKQRSAPAHLVTSVTAVPAPVANHHERLVVPGNFVTKNTHLLTLTDPTSLLAKVYASELVLPHVRGGDLGATQYDQALEQGLPVATGVIEGASQHLVNLE